MASGQASTLKVNSSSNDARAVIAPASANDPDPTDGLIVPRINAFPGNASGFNNAPAAASKGMLVYLQQSFTGDANAAGYVNGQVYAPGYYYWSGTAWLKFNSTASATATTNATDSSIYNVDGVLKDNRTVTLGSKSLTFSGNAGVITAGAAYFQSGSSNSGNIALAPGTSTSAGYMKIYNGSGVALGLIGLDNNNMVYSAQNTANHVFTGPGGYGAVQIGNPGTSNGYVTLAPGTSTSAGYMKIYNGSGVALGLIGLDNNNMVYSAVNGTSHVFTGGYVGIGATPTFPITVTGNINSWIGSFENQFSTGNGLEIFLSGSNSSSGLRTFVNFDVAGSTCGAIYKVAGAAQVAYNTTSDIRLKKDIVNTHYSLSDVMKIEVKDYVYKDIINPTPQTGFIAQQLFTVFPNAVTKGGEDATKNPWQVDYSKVTPLLVKAIQEQQAEIETLKAEVNNLKKGK